MMSLINQSQILYFCDVTQTYPTTTGANDKQRDVTYCDICKHQVTILYRKYHYESAHGYVLCIARSGLEPATARWTWIK